MHFLNHILAYVILPLLVLTVAATYYRFVVLHDHTVSYEGVCDPASESCFVGCEDEECTQEYFYTVIERYAPNLVDLCGDNIIDCAAADTCLPNEEDCTVLYCDPEIDVDLCDTTHGTMDLDVQEIFTPPSSDEVLENSDNI